eukprot:1745968-Pleurochrysis_carterae.AAC.1
MIQLQRERLEKVEKELAVGVDGSSAVKIEVLVPAVGALERNVGLRAVVFYQPRDELALAFALGVVTLVVKLL